MTEKLFTLPVLKQITPAISQRQIDELPVLVITHPKLRAAITFQGAHLVAWQPEGEEPIIWLSKETAFKPGVAIRGGRANLLAVVRPRGETFARLCAQFGVGTDLT